VKKSLIAAAIATAIAAPVQAAGLPDNQRPTISANRAAQAQKQRQGQRQGQQQNAAAVAAGGDAFAGGGSSDNSNPQSTSVDNGSGDSWSISPAYSEGSLPPSPVLHPGFADVPQSSYGLKVLGPVLTVTETGPAPCVMSNAWAVAALKRQQLVDASTLYAAGVEPYFVEYNQAVAVAAAECAR
jgi:hypothetical protein